jgi:Tfp pilus assembly protein PilF
LPRIYIGLVYEAQAKSARAEAAYKQAARLDPRNYIPHQCLSHFYVRGGRFKEAEREADIAIKMNPDDGYSYLILGKIYQATRRWSLAVNAYEKGMSLSPRLDRVERAAVSSRLLECQLMVEKRKGKN